VVALSRFNNQSSSRIGAWIANALPHREGVVGRFPPYVHDKYVTVKQVSYHLSASDEAGPSADGFPCGLSRAADRDVWMKMRDGLFGWYKIFNGN